MKPKRETAEQRARRIGRGLGFILTLDDLPGVGWGKWRRPVATRERDMRMVERPTDDEVALWRALERSQRALARKRGVRL